MDDVEIRVAYYSGGGINSRHRLQRLLQHLHHIINSIYRPPDDPGKTQGTKISEEPKIPQRERASWPIEAPKRVPMREESMREEDSTFEDPQREVKKPMRKEREREKWIIEKTRRMEDKRMTLRRKNPVE